MFCERVGIPWPAGFTHGGDRKSMKTYVVSLSECKNWKVDNIEPWGNGKITMSKVAYGSIDHELPDGKILHVELSSPARQFSTPDNTKIKGADIVSAEGEIVRYLKPEQIRIEA